MYTRDNNGKCVIESNELLIIGKVRFFLNLIRRKGFKFMLMMLDDIWLYNYHKQSYDGIMKETLDLIQVLEERQWELVGLEQIK